MQTMQDRHKMEEKMTNFYRSEGWGGEIPGDPKKPK
jgi:hypothetical protein